MKSGSCTVSLRACLGGTHLQFESIFSCSGYFDIHTFFFLWDPLVVDFHSASMITPRQYLTL